MKVLSLEADPASTSPDWAGSLPAGWDLVRARAGRHGAPRLEDVSFPDRELVWLLPAGVRPATGAVEGLSVWLARSPVRLGARAFYGDSLADGRPLTRPRAERFSLWAADSAGDSIVVRAGLLRETLARLVEPSEWWYQLRLAAIEDGLAHVPVFFDSWDLANPPTAPGVGPAPFSWASRAAVLESLAYVSATERPTPAGPRLRLRGNTERASVSVVIPSIGTPVTTPEGSEPALWRCLRSLAGENVRDVVVVAGPRMPEDVLAAAHAIADVTEVRVPDPFNFSASINAGVAASRGSHVLLLNDDVEATTPGWVDSLLGLVTLPDVGAVGARLMFPDATIQHAGIVINPRNLEPNHLYMGLRPEDVCDPVASGLAHFLAVTGACLLVSKENYCAVGGLSEDLPLNYNDVDFCLKLHACGLTNLQDNTTSLIHRESTTRTHVLTDIEAGWMAQWEPWIGQDPYVNVWG